MYKYITISMGYVNPVSTGTELRVETATRCLRKDRKEVHRASDRLELKFKDKCSIANYIN